MAPAARFSADRRRGEVAQQALQLRVQGVFVVGRTDLLDGVRKAQQHGPATPLRESSRTLPRCYCYSFQSSLARAHRMVAADRRLAHTCLACPNYPIASATRVAVANPHRVLRCRCSTQKKIREASTGKARLLPCGRLVAGSNHCQRRLFVGRHSTPAVQAEDAIPAAPHDRTSGRRHPGPTSMATLCAILSFTRSQSVRSIPRPVNAAWPSRRGSRKSADSSPGSAPAWAPSPRKP